MQAAGTKWNFLPFRPGLVGGHCIGVDPYYLTHKAEAIGYHPEIILAGRRLNDGMGAYVTSQLVKALIKRRIHVDGARILIMGLTFKENCPDLRNTRVIDIIRELADYNANVDVHDPWASAEEALHEYDVLSSRSRSRPPMTPLSWRSRMTSFANLARRSGTSAKNSTCSRSQICSGSRPVRSAPLMRFVEWLVMKRRAPPCAAVRGAG